MITRRSMLLGLTASLIAAPAVIRTPGLLMKIVAPKPVPLVINYIPPPSPAFLVQWSEDNKMWQSDPLGRGGRYVRMAYSPDLWPSRTIKALPGGFKIARA